MNKIKPQLIWKGFHWSFFINIQGLIICLGRFEMFLTRGELVKAQVELETAADLMLASSATMKLAGSFSRQEYENQVRPAMTPPHVKSPSFSGLMSWEHASLIQIWKKLSPVFEELPIALKPQHERFVAAYLKLVTAHKAVCEKFGGAEAGSLRFSKSRAVDTIDKFGQNRWRLITSQHQSFNGCPFHKHET